VSYKVYPVNAPFKGIVNNVPSPYNPPASFDDILNFFIWKGRIRTRPKLTAKASVTDSCIIRNMITFQDVTTAFHTLLLTTKTPYYITGTGPTYTAVTLPGGITDLSGTSLPYGIAAPFNRVYFSNGSVRLLYADGGAGCSVGGKLNAGGTDYFSCRFLTVNAYHLIAAYTTEYVSAVTTTYPSRVRWSKSGDPNDWYSLSSGLNDIIDVSDQITGLMTVGRNTFIARKNGYTIMYPTGVGIDAFKFENYSYAPEGVGVKYPYSLAVYGSDAVFVAAEDIYCIQGGTNFRPIGGEVKKAIFEDISKASGDVIRGFLVPRLGVNYDFYSYWLSIPGVNVSWVYSFDADSWMRFNSSAGALTCVNTVALA